MTIKVLAASTKDKGRLLEQVVRRLLDELGYDDFRARISSGGTDIEVKATALRRRCISKGCLVGLIVS